MKDPGPQADSASSECSTLALRVTRPLDIEVGPLLSKYYPIVLLVGLLAGLAGWASVAALPKQYSSTIYLRIDEPTARSADALMHSTPVLDAVIAKLDAPAGTVEQRRRWLDTKRSLTVAPGDSATGAHLFRQEIMDTDPARAKAINTAFVDAWLNAAKPAPIRKAIIESEIARFEEQLKLIDRFLQQLDKQASNIAAAPPPQADARLPTIIALPADASTSGAAALLAKRDEAATALAKLRQELLGVTRDTVLSDPSLPEEPSWPQPLRLTVLTVAAVEIVLLILIVTREAGWIRWRR